MSRIIKSAVAVVATVILGFTSGIIFMGGGVSAHDPAGTANDPKLEKFRSPDLADGTATSLISYKSVAGGDAPGSLQNRALRVETETNTYIANSDGSCAVQASFPACSYAGVTVLNTSIDGQAVADINRLSFKTKGSYTGGGGSPRLSLFLSDNTVAFLASDHCSTPMNPGTWRKANFLASFAANPTCNIDTYSGSYASDAVSSAWDKFVAAEGAKEVTALQLVVDEGPSVQWIDDIRVNGLVFAGPNITTHSH